MSGQIRVLRDPKMEVPGASYQSYLVESAINRFFLKVDARDVSERQLAFQWSSPGGGLVANPRVIISTDWIVKIPGRYDAVASRMPGVAEGVDAATNALEADDGSEYLKRGTCQVCFGPGDAFGSSCQAVNCIINGAAVSLHNLDRYWETLSQAWVAPDELQRVYSRCGGCPDKYDARAVQGKQIGDADILTVGLTTDSGIDQRKRNFFHSQLEQAQDEQDAYTKLKIRVQWPVIGAIFSPFQQNRYKMAGDAIFQDLPYAIPNLNNCQITVLMDSIKKKLFQVLSTDMQANLSNNGTFFQADRASVVPASIALDTSTTPSLHVEYLRLAEHRQIRDSYQLASWRAVVHNPSVFKPTACPTMAAALQDQGVGDLVVVPASYDCVSSFSIRAPMDNDAQYVDVQFNNIVYPSPPNFLLICCEKDAKIVAQSKTQLSGALQYGYGGAVGARYINALTAAPDADQDEERTSKYHRAFGSAMKTNLSMEKFTLRIQSNVGSYELTSDAKPYLMERQKLYRDVMKNCSSLYPLDEDQWHQYRNFILLNSGDYLSGLSFQNTAFPITINCKFTAKNKAMFLTGEACVVATGDNDCIAPVRSLWEGRASLVGIYDSILNMSTHSAVLTSAIFSAETSDATVAQAAG